MGNFSSVASNPDGIEVSYRWEKCKLVSQIRMIFSYLVTFLTWVCAFNSLSFASSVPIGVYLFLFALPLTALEFSALFMACCTFCKEEGRFCRVWHFVLRLDGWQRGVFYVIVAIPLFIMSTSLWNPFALIMSILITGLGLLYIVKKFAVITIQVPPPTSFAQAGAPSAYSGSLPPAGAPRDHKQFSEIP